MRNSTPYFSELLNSRESEENQDLSLYSILYSIHSVYSDFMAEIMTLSTTITSTEYKHKEIRNIMTTNLNSLNG